ISKRMERLKCVVLTGSDRDPEDVRCLRILGCHALFVACACSGPATLIPDGGVGETDAPAPPADCGALPALAPVGCVATWLDYVNLVRVRSGASAVTEDEEMSRGALLHAR